MIIAFYPGAGGNRFLQRLLGNTWTQLHLSYDNTNATQQYKHRYLIDPIPHPNSQHILTHCMNSQKIQQTFPGHPIVFIKSKLQVSLQREWALHGHQRFMNQKIKNTVSRLEHYNAFKSPDWPNIDTEDQIDQLPVIIKQEVQTDYDNVINNTVKDSPSILAQLIRDNNDKINSAYEIIKWHLNYYQRYPVDFCRAEQVINIDNDNDDFSSVMTTELNLYQSEIFNQVWQAINEQ